MVTPPRYIPDRGDVIWLHFDPQAGHEQAGRRPALVLSFAGYNASAKLALVCPITNQIKGYPFEVVIPSGLSVRGAVLADQVRSLDYRARNAEFLTKLPPDIVQAVLDKAHLLLS